jgi:hydroxymethylpyrimidine/phosphomethylpyrimidine kinase
MIAPRRTRRARREKGGAPGAAPHELPRLREAGERGAVRGPAPRVLVVAGLDPSGGAGLVADLEALRAAGAKGWAVAAALTAQGPRGAAGFQPVSEEMLLAQIDALLGGRERPRAVKTGMLGNAALARALDDRLRAPPLRRLPLVVDPVLRASSGASLFDAGGLSRGEALVPLLARAWLATPNLAELSLLTGEDVSTDEAAIHAARHLPSRAVLVKGGHREGAPVDLLVDGARVVRFAGRRRAGTARGTGCRLASGIAAFLARGAPLEEAVRRAKRNVERYLDAAG